MPEGVFSVAVAEFADSAKSDINKFCIEFPQDLKEAVVENTPVISGNLRRGWYDKWEGKIFSFMNGVFYGPFVEFGTSRMRARAFVRSVLARADEIAAATLARIRKN